MQKRIFTFALLMMMCLTLAPAGALAANLSGNPGGNAGYAGLWQNANMVSDAYTTRLALNADGTFYYAASQYEGMTRERYRFGTWSVDGRVLKLNVQERIFWVGGEVVQLPYLTEPSIENPETLLLRNSETLEYELGAVTTDPEVFDKPTFTIAGKRFWELSDAPDSLQIEYDANKAEAKTLFRGAGSAGAAENTGAPEIFTAFRMLQEPDAELLALAAYVALLLKNKDWEALSYLAHPNRGVAFSPWPYVDEENRVELSADNIKALGSDNTVRVWGELPSGDPIECAFAEYYDRYIFDRDYTTAPQAGLDRYIKESNDVDNLFTFTGGDFGGYVDFYIPGSGPDADFNWSSLRLAFDWYKTEDNAPGRLYLTAIVHGCWTM
jgi:hypothetical protein